MGTGRYRGGEEARYRKGGTMRQNRWETDPQRWEQKERARDRKRDTNSREIGRERDGRGDREKGGAVRDGGEAER